MAKRTVIVVVLLVLLAGCAPGQAPTLPTRVASPPKTLETVAPAPAKAATAPATTPQTTTPTTVPKAPTGEPSYGGILDTTAGKEPPDLDGLWGTSIFSQVYTNPSYNGLLQYDPLENTKIVPRLAESWETSPDGRVLTFRLSKGVKWHDGQPFNAQDVKSTMDLWQKPPPGKMFLGQPLKGLTRTVEIIDDYTVKVTLERRSNTYLAFLAAGNIGTIAPKHILVKQQGLMKNTVIGTGPFKFKKYDSGVLYEVAKNPDYFVKGRPYLDGLRTYVIKDRSTMLAAFRAGRIKVTWVQSGTMAPSQAEAIKKSVPQAEVYTEDMLLNVSLFVNHGRAPWSDRRVRKAVNLAVDRQAAVATLNEGVGTIGSHVPLSPLTMTQAEILQKPGYRQPKDQDIAEARKLLAEAGYPNGFKSTILVRGGSKVFEDRSVFAKDQLARIGIDLQLDTREEAVWSRLRKDRDFDTMMIGTSFYMADPLGGTVYYGPGNDFNFENPKRDELMLKYDSAPTEAERKRAALELEQFMMEELPYVAFFWQPEQRAHWKEVQNMKPASGLANNNTFEAVYIAK